MADDRFDVPELDTIYIDKPLQKHNLIQTISRANRKPEGKKQRIAVDYIGIKVDEPCTGNVFACHQLWKDIQQSVNSS